MIYCNFALKVKDGELTAPDKNQSILVRFCGFLHYNQGRGAASSHKINRIIIFAENIIIRELISPHPWSMDSKFFDKNAEIQTTHNDLPHWNQDGKLYFVTYRLADSLPQTTLVDLQREKMLWLENHPIPWSEETEKEYHHRFSQFVDRWLDANYGSCILSIPEIATLVEKNLWFNNSFKYLLHSYVIMPNHIHVLLEVFEGHKIQKIMHSWKSYTANQINKALGKTGSVWWHESFDRIIRDENHYKNVKNYILKNVKQCGVKWLI